MLLKIPSNQVVQAANLLLDQEKLMEFEKEIAVANKIYSDAIKKAYDRSESFETFAKSMNFVCDEYEKCLGKFLQLHTKELQIAHS